MHFSIETCGINFGYMLKAEVWFASVAAAMGMLRSSPAHLVYKFGYAPHYIVEFIPFIDKKKLSEENMSSEYMNMLKSSAMLCGRVKRATRRQSRRRRRSRTVFNSMSNLTYERTQNVDLAAFEAKVISPDCEPSQRKERGAIGSIHIHGRELASPTSYNKHVGRYFRSVDSVRETYLENFHEISNLSEFLAMATEASDELFSNAVIQY